MAPAGNPILHIKFSLSNLCRTKMILFILIIASFYPASFCFEGEYTIIIDAGKKECFYQDVKIGNTIDIEYQVIDGGHGDLDISFELIEPTGRILLADFKKSENVHRIKAHAEGDYRLCFDNSFSTFNRKSLFFEIIVENDDNNDNNDDIKRNTWNNLSSEDDYEPNVQDILDYIIRIRNLLTKARQLQDMLKSHEARDRNIAEENYFKVNAWSLFQIIFMLIVGALQVFMVRCIFETDCTVNTIFKKLNL